MDISFSKTYNTNAKSFQAEKNDIISRINLERNNLLQRTFSAVEPEQKEYKDFLYEYSKAKFVYDNANDIYRGSSDPRESANAQNLAKMINVLYPDIPVDVAERGYRGMIKQLTGDDMSATNVMDVAGKKIIQGLQNSWLGIKNYLHVATNDWFKVTGEPDEVTQQKEQKYKNELDKMLASYPRVDYYNKDFDSFLDKMVLSAADFIPSEIVSMTPALIGGALTAVTGLPAFYAGGRAISGAMAGFMEAGSASLDLYQAGADTKTQLAFSTIVGLINGSLEYIGNIPDRIVEEKFLNIRKLRKAVGFDKNVTRGLIRDVVGKWGFDYALGLITEPATEALQELTSMYVMNMASDWQERNTGKPFSSEFTYTPEQLADGMKEVALSTFRGQLLLGLSGVATDAISSMRKGGKVMNWEWEKGDLRRITETRKYSTYSDNSVLVSNDLINVNNNAKTYAPEVDDKGLPTEPLKPIQVRNIGGQYIPVYDEGMARAKYLKGNSEYGMYVEVVNDSAVNKEAMSSSELKRIVNSLPDEINGHQVDYGFNDNGDIVIEDRNELDAIVAEFVSSNISKVTNVNKTDTGYTVTVNDKNVNFTTEATDTTQFTQADYVREAKESAEAQPKKEMSEDWKQRVSDIKSRAERISLVKKNVKTRDFNKAIDKVINAGIEDIGQRKAEKAKVDSKVKSITAEYEKAINKAIEQQPNSDFAKMFKDRNITDSATSLARATVMASAKMAQSMNTSISDFMNKVNFVFNPEYMKGGKARAGWTEVKSDGTFDVNITSLFDQTTGMHEMGHVYLSMIGDNYKGIEGFEKQFAKEIEADGGKIGRNTQEAFAEALEAYVNEGLAGSEGLKRVFELVLDALRNFVNAVRDLLSPEKVAMFDNLFEKGIKDYNPELANTDAGTYYAKDVDTDIEFQRQYDEIVSRYKDTDLWMKAPNGKPTNLSEKLWVTVRTPNFIRWFGDWINDSENASKVVDENGEPFPCHHGTNKEFDEFIATSTGNLGSGNYFFPNIESSEAWANANVIARGGEANVVSAFLNIRNPFIMEPELYTWRQAGVENFDRGTAMTEELKSKGYDGVFYFYDGYVQEINAYSSNQIKSVDNNGNFSDVGNIYFKDADINSYVKPQKLTKKAMNETEVESELLGDALSDMSTEDFRTKYGIDVDGRMSVLQIRDALIEKGREYVKSAGLGNEYKFSGKMIEYCANAVLNEIQQRKDNLGIDNVPIGWYSTEVDLALRLLAKDDLFPELATSDEARSAFILMWAITSQGETLQVNTGHTIQNYKYFREHGVFPVGDDLRGRFTGDKGVLDKQFRKVNEYILNYGNTLNAFRQFLLKEDTAGNIAKNTGNKVSNMAVDTTTTYAGMFGPKIGTGFTTNLLGNYDYGTIDLWMKRAYERLTGAPDLSGDSPTAKGRRFIQSVMERVVELYNADKVYADEMVNVSDVQAVMWYNEKNIYDKIQSASREVIGKSYSRVVAEALHKQSYIEKFGEKAYNKLSEEQINYDVQRLLDSERYNARAGMESSFDTMSERGTEETTSELVENRNGKDEFFGKIQGLRAGIEKSDRIKYTRRGRSVFGYTGFMEEFGGVQDGLSEYGRVVPYRSRVLKNPKSVDIKIGRAKFSFKTKNIYSPASEYAQDMFNSTLGKRVINKADFYEIEHDSEGTASIKEWKRLFDKVKETQGQAQYRLSSYSVNDLKDTRLFVSSDGKMMFGITKDKEICAVVSDKSSKGAIYSIIPTAIEAGGRWLNCFDIDLPKIYSKFGFVADSRLKFDFNALGKTAKEHWDNSTPDLVFMSFNPSVAQSNPNFTPLLMSTYAPYIDSYSDAEAYTKKVVEQNESYRYKTEGEVLFKDAYDYNNDYHYNFERAVESKKNNDEETLSKLRAIRDAFRNGLLEAVKDEYFDGVDIVVFNPENVSADFLDGGDASEFVWKMLEDPLVTTYNSMEGTEATIHLPSGDDLHLFISSRTDNEYFIEYRDSFISNKLMNNDEDEQKTNSYETFVSDAFSDVERNLTGGLHRITYNGGTSRYVAPNYSQSMDYVFSGEGFAEFGVGMYDTSVKDIAKGYAHSIANMKKFRNGGKNFDMIVHTNIISGDNNNFMSWEEPVTMDLYDDVVRTLNELHYNLDDVSLDTSSGENLYRSLADAFDDDAMATQVLKEAGLEGLRYNTDSIFEGKGDGVNYVVFDDAFVRTIREESYTDSGIRIDDTRFKRPEFMLYKNADLDMDVKDVTKTLKEGGFVPNEVLDKYADNDYVKIERIAQNIAGTKPEWFKLYKRAVDEYLLEKGITYGKLTFIDKKRILDSWNKKLKGANYYMEVPDTGNNYDVLIDRLNAYANMESPERAETAWMNRLTHTRNGRENIRELALEMKKNGMFNDTLEGYDLSAKYPALNMIANKTESANKRGVRPRIDVSVYESAKEEAFRNRQDIREALNDDETNTYESNMNEADTTTNYMESADIQEILNEKGVSKEIKELVKNGMWDGTVIRDLMKKATDTLEKLNSTNATLDLTGRELEIERERVKLYQKELEKAQKKNENVSRLRKMLGEAMDRANTLELAYTALSDLYATQRLQSALYKTQRQINDMVRGKTGEADTNRAIRDAVKAIMRFTEENRRLNPELKGKIYIDDMKDHEVDGKEVKGKAPALADFLESNGFIDDEGNLLNGIDKMNEAELNAFKKAVNTDKENSKYRQNAKQRDFEANTMAIASKIVSSMRPKNIDKNLTAEDRKLIKEETEKRTEGVTSNIEKARIAEEVRGEVIAKKIQDIADGARYGIQAHSEAVNKKRVIDDFTTLSRLLGAISPDLRKFVMDGLNKATDGKYRMVDKRMAQFYENVKQMFKISSDKKLKSFLSELVNTRMDIGKVKEEQIPLKLRTNKLFMDMWAYDEKHNNNERKTELKYSVQDLMAIYEQSKEWDGLRHLNKGCNVPASEIAWVVNQFESENGSLKDYRKLADEIQRVYAERFTDLYNVVLNVDNREMVKVSSYSPMFGVGLNKDLMMKFGELFGDDRKAQANWFTKDREFGTSPIDLNYYSRLEKVVEMQEAYINGAEFYKQLDYLFSEKGGNLRNIITEVYGEPQFRRIEEILDLTKSDSVRNIISEADNMASKIRNHYVMARLAYNLSSVFQQVGSFFLGLQKYNVFDLWKSSMQFILHPIQMSKRVYELSPQMKHAVNPLIRMAYETGKSDPKTFGGKIDKFVSAIGEKGLVMMEKQDHIIRNILWWTSYQKEIANAQKAKAKALAEQGITNPTSEQLSLTFEEQDQCQRDATQWVLDIQSSSQVKDNSLMYAGGNLFWKNILMFTNQLNKEWNMLYVDGIKGGLFQKDFAKFFGNMAALSLATMWVVACTGKIKNDEDDDETWAEDLLKDWGFEFTSRVPLVGNLTKNVYEGFAYRQSDDIVTRLTQAILTLTNEKAKTKSKITAMKNVGWSALDLIGAPTTAVKRTYNAFEDGEIFEADHFMRFFGGEWYKYFED